jgi:hypothetical protein
MYFVQGGGTNLGYVTALYRELLLRDPDPAGLQGWTSSLDRGNPRSTVSEGIWYSPEKFEVRVNEAFMFFLGRPASAAEQKNWSRFAQINGVSKLRAAIMSSDEYWIRANQRY